MTESVNPSSVLVIGCGYLGRRVADAWQRMGRHVLAVTRSRAEELSAAGFEPIVADVLHPDSLPTLPPVDTLIYAVGLDRRAGHSMRDVYVRGLENVLESLARHHAIPERFLYVSSTSVYGQSDGQEVDETADTRPVDDSGRVVLEAETLLRSRLPEAIVLRFAGIYGPGRLLRKQPLLAGQPLMGDAEKWLNLIHVADGATAVLAAEASGRSGETYNIADDSPVRRRDFYTHLAELLHAPAARFEPHPIDSTIPLEANRRIVNRKARTELGFRPRYPSYVEGLAASLSE